MKKAKNILLLTGICLYVINITLSFLATAPNIFPISKPVMLYVINGFFLNAVEALVFMILPIVLLFFNLKGKCSKVFSIIVAVLSVLSSACVLFEMINSHYFTVLKYLLFSKLGLVDTYFIYLVPRFFFPSVGLFGFVSLIALIMIVVGAIFSLKKEKKED